MRSRDRIAIGWLDPGQVDGAFAADLIRLARSRDAMLHPSTIRVESGGLLSRGRNELVRTFLEHTDAAWLWMLDTDHRVPVEAFDRLANALHDTAAPVLAGLYFAAYPGSIYPTPVPAIYRLAPNGQHAPIHDYPHDAIIPIDAAGTGCLVVHRRVLEELRATAVAGERDWCWFRDGPVNGSWLSEDLTFCARLRAAGVPLHAHTGAVLPHRKQYWLDDRHHQGGRP